MKRVHLILSDDLHKDWSQLKAELGMTWEEFMAHAITHLPTVTISGGDEE